MNLKDLLYHLQVVERLNKKVFRKLTTTVHLEGYRFIKIGKTILWMDEIDFNNIAGRLDYWDVLYKDVAIFDQESTREWGTIRSWASDADKYYNELKEA